MKPGERRLKVLRRKDEPEKMVALRFGWYDVAIKTDEEGNPIPAFVGKADERGIIKGDQYVRLTLTQRHDQSGHTGSLRP